MFFFSILNFILLFFFFFQAEDGIRDGTVTGVQTCALPIFLSVASGKPAAFARQDLDTLQRLAQQAAIAMANARLYAEAKLKTARLETLIRVSQVMTSTLEPQRIAEVITEAMNDLAPGIVVRMWETPDDAKIWVPFGPAPSARDGHVEDDL